MIIRLALALGLLLSGLLFYEMVWADAGHADGACFGQSWDNKTGPEQIWWKTATGCNDHPADILNFLVQVEKFDWNSWAWSGRDQHQQYGGQQENTSFTAASRWWTVLVPGPPYEGMACYRIRVAHFVAAWTQPEPTILWEDHSVSWGECY